MKFARGLFLSICVGFAVVGCFVTGCSAASSSKGSSGSSAAGGATMSVSPQSALLDAPVAVSVNGLPAGANVTITATASDRRGTPWTSSAQFAATSAGVVTLDQAPSGGSYTGHNPMGLFTFMAPPPADSKDLAFVSPQDGYDVTLQATVDGAIVATTTAHRQAPSAVGVVEEDIRPDTDGVYGDVFAPPDPATKHPAVLVFGGSEGGLGTSTFVASLLAAHGYPTLALAYFNEPGLPQGLDNIPLEYFARAVDVLREQPGVDHDHVLVMGDSRGSEAALLLGANFRKLVNGVIAGVPSSVVNPGYPDTTQPAWTLHGRPFAAANSTTLGDPEAAGKQGVIPVEKIAGRILLTCGGQDAVWNSCSYSDAITARLSANHFAYPVTALRYPEAGHLAGGLAVYYSLTEGALNGSGGTLNGNQAALADGYRKLLSFLSAQ